MLNEVQRADFGKLVAKRLRQAGVIAEKDRRHVAGLIALMLEDFQTKVRLGLWRSRWSDPEPEELCEIWESPKGGRKMDKMLTLKLGRLHVKIDIWDSSSLPEYGITVDVHRGPWSELCFGLYLQFGRINFDFIVDLRRKEE